MNFVYYESKFKIFFCFFFLRGGCGRGRRGGGLTDGQTYRPKPICPFNFFDVGGVTMH